MERSFAARGVPQTRRDLFARAARFSAKLGRMRLLSCFSLVLLVAFGACGGDEGGAADDSTDTADDTTDDTVDDTADDTADDTTPPDAAPDTATLEANCDALDLAAAPEIPLVVQQITPNPQGGTVVAGTYELSSIKLYANGLPVTGTAQGRVEIVISTATAGAARVAMAIDGMALGQAVMENLAGAGLYTITASDLTVADGCGGSEPLPVLSYTATGTTLTLWTEYMITDPIALTIPLELVLDLE